MILVNRGQNKRSLILYIFWNQNSHAILIGADKVVVDFQQVCIAVHLFLMEIYFDAIIMDGALKVP